MANTTFKKALQKYVNAVDLVEYDALIDIAKLINAQKPENWINNEGDASDNFINACMGLYESSYLPRIHEIIYTFYKTVLNVKLSVSANIELLNIVEKDFENKRDTWLSDFDLKIRRLSTRINKADILYNDFIQVNSEVKTAKDKMSYKLTIGNSLYYGSFFTSMSKVQRANISWYATQMQNIVGSSIE